MEGDQKTYELRSRSRSRSETPLNLNILEGENDGTEHHYDLRSRSRDRSMTPSIEVSSSSRRSTSVSLPSSVVKARYKNMEPISEQNDTLTEMTAETPSKSTAKSETVKSTKKVERRSERQKTKRQIFANGQSESKDDSSDTRSETKRAMTSDYSSEEGDREDVLSRPSTYEFYKQQGEYWNKLPKTDYTYSQTSQCRYEVAPGILAIPNMSRRSLHSESLSQSSQDSLLADEKTTMDPVEQVIPHIRSKTTAGQSVVINRTTVTQRTRCERAVYNTLYDNKVNERFEYESWAGKLSDNYRLNNNSYRDKINVDSDTDLEDTGSSANYTLRHVQQKSSATSLISSWFYAVLHFVTFGQFKKREFSTSHYYHRYQETRWSRLRRQFDTVMQHIYLLFVKVLLFDSWLLSRLSKLRDRAQGRRSKIIWLLLPLVLTIGYLFLPHILSAIPLKYQQTTLPLERETPVVQSYSPEDLKANQELKDLVHLLIKRVQHLESAKAEQSVHLANVTQAVEDLKRTDSDSWEKYDEKLANLEQEIELQKNNKEECHAEEFDVIRVEVLKLKQLYAQLKTCCDTPSNVVNEEEIRKQADNVFAGYFGDSFSKDDVVRLFQIMNLKIQQDEQQKSSGVVGAPGDDEPKGGSSSLGIDEIRKIILGILKIYDADKTGRVDYALEPAGGQVISTRCTQKYNVHTRAFKILGVTLFYESNNPRTVIQGNTLQPGMCWAFQDFPGYLLIRLRSPIYVTGFTLEHAPKANLPNGEMKSAPKKFNVWGLRGEDDLEPVLYGEYDFLDSEDSLQYFPVQNTAITEAYEYVELRIHSNHGQLEYTCLYRFRVHGNLA